MNDISDVSSKGKRKFNTVADDEGNKKHISETFKNEKEDMEFVGGLALIMRVKVNSNVWNQIIKGAMLTQLENCSRGEFESFKNDFYVGCSTTYNRSKKKKRDTGRRQEDRTRILNDKWVKMYFDKSFCKELEKKFHLWVTVTKEKAE